LPLAGANGWRARVVTQDGQVIAVAPVTASPLGLAVDIGTTKVAAYLIDLESGETLAAASAMNPQIAYGEDVMARIAYAMEGGTQARELQHALVGGLDDLARELCAQVGRDSAEIVEVVLVGNTCMHHLVLGLPVRQLGLAPYVPALAHSYDLKAQELALRFAPGANVHLLPNIAGFVGADHVAMLLATGVHEAREVTVGLDIGTNTEISLAVGGAGFPACRSGERSLEDRPYGIESYRLFQSGSVLTRAIAPPSTPSEMPGSGTPSAHSTGPITVSANTVERARWTRSSPTRTDQRSTTATSAPSARRGDRHTSAPVSLERPMPPSNRMKMDQSWPTTAITPAAAAAHGLCVSSVAPATAAHPRSASTTAVNAPAHTPATRDTFSPPV
jgi:hypothetical protein